MFEPTTGTQVLATRCCYCRVLRRTRILVGCLGSSLLLTFVHSSAKCKKTHQKKHIETSLNAADFYINQYETSFCHFVLENEQKLILEVFNLILENEKLFPKLSILIKLYNFYSPLLCWRKKFARYSANLSSSTAAVAATARTKLTSPSAAAAQQQQ